MLRLAGNVRYVSRFKGIAFMNTPSPSPAPQALRLQPATSFVETPFVRELTTRALAYLAAGFPVHFRGPAGSGKTTLAMHVASQLGRPVMLMMGDDEYNTSDLVGKEKGFRRPVWWTTTSTR
jgi:MoxR-like ATPase